MHKILRAKSQGVSSRLAHPAGRLSDSWRRLLAKLSGQPTPGSVPSPPRAQSLSRADRRSLRAFAVAALACAALMGFSATAQAQTDVLSATLTVKDLGTSQVGCANTTPSARCSDFLSEDEFTYDSTDYAVTDLFVRPSGSLVLGFNADLTTAAQTLTLDVAGTTFAFEDAETKTTAVRIWSNSGLSWSVDDPVVVKLVEPAPTVPGAPVLTATANGQTQIDLSWTVPDTGGRALDKYSIDVSADGGTTWSPLADTSATITTYSHTGLTAGTTRHYRVAAVNPIGTGAWSNVDSATTTAAVANTPATGSPVITGTAQVGQSLYASLGSVADADGPSIIVASYQWIRVDGATETDITGATITPYTPVADDVGKQLKVRASFTDDLGNPESRTSPATQAVQAAGNNAPEFTEGTSTTRSVAENTASSRNIGTAIAATDANSGDTLRYTLGGTDMASFAIVSTSGQLQTRAALDFETKSSYAVTVSVSDGNGGSDSIGVTITVTDVNEQPGRPAAPSVGATANSDTSLDVSWAAPGLNGGPAITGYNLQYRQGTTGSFTNGPQNVSGTSAMITGLTAGTSYQVQVRALNGETPSDWSSAGTGSTSSTAQPTLTLDIDPNRFGEAAGSVQICVVPSAVSTQRVTVQVATADGTATAPGDYVAHSGTVALQPQQQRACFTVTLVDDADAEGDETFTVRLSNPVNATLGGARAVATITIVDNDGGANVAPTFTEGTSTTRSVAENTPSGANIGAPVAATDADSGDTLEYTLGGTDIKSFGIHLNTGQLLTLDALDFETKPSYAVSISVSDGNGGTDSIEVAITVTDVDEQPLAPQSPRVTKTEEGTSLMVEWSPPPATGTTFYDLRYRAEGGTDWIDGPQNVNGTNATITGLDADTEYEVQVRGDNAQGAGPWSPSGSTRKPPSRPRTSAPGAPRNLTAVGGDGQVVLTWRAPSSDGGAAITDYEYRIDRRNPWISTGSTETTYTVTGLVNGTSYTFQVRAVNRRGKGRASSRAEAAPVAPEVFSLDFTHFANGDDTTSDLVFVNVGSVPVRPAIYFYDTEGALVSAESVVEVTGDLVIQEDGGLTVLTEMEPLGELTIATHGQGDLVSGSVKVASEGLIGGMLRYNLPGIGEAVVEASPPVSDALFPVRRQEGGITTGVAIHNLGAEAVEVSCQLMSGGVVLEEVEIPLEANGQTAWLIDAAFPAADTSDFAGSVRCDAPGRRRFSAVALEMDPGTRVFITLPLFPVDRGGGGPEAALDFAHFTNGDGTTSDLVFVNMKTQPSGPAPTPFHVAIPPIRPVLYFYDKEGNPIAAESVVDVTGDLEITEDGGLTVQTQMKPLGVLTVSTHGQGPLVTGSVRVVSEAPIGGMLRYDLPHIGVAVVEASSPISDAIFPVRRQEGGITTGVAHPQPGIESGAGALRLDARGRAARRREFPSGGQRADVLAHRPGVPRDRYVRLRGIGALRCGWRGAVQRRGPGNGPRHPHLHDFAGGAVGREDAPGIVAARFHSRLRTGGCGPRRCGYRPGIRGREKMSGGMLAVGAD